MMKKKTEKIQKNNQKSFKKEKKNIKKRAKKLATTLNWLDVESIEHNECIINDSGTEYIVRGIKIHPLNIHMLNVDDNYRVIESLAIAFNKINFKFYWKFVYQQPNLDEQNHNLIRILKNEEDKSILNLGDMFLNYHEWYINNFKEISFYFIVMENEKMIDKVYTDLKRFMTETRLMISPMTNDDFRNMIAYDFDNPAIDEYYFSVLKEIERFEFGDNKIGLEEKK